MSSVFTTDVSAVADQRIFKSGQHLVGHSPITIGKTVLCVSASVPLVVGGYHLAKWILRRKVRYLSYEDEVELSEVVRAVRDGVAGVTDDKDKVDTGKRPIADADSDEPVPWHGWNENGDPAVHINGVEPVNVDFSEGNFGSATTRAQEDVISDWRAANREAGEGDGGWTIPVAVPRVRKPRPKYKVAVEAAIDAINEFGTMSHTEASRMVLHRHIRDYMRERKMRPSHILEQLPMAVELAMIPTQAGVKAKSANAASAAIMQRANDVSTWVNPFFFWESGSRASK